MDWELTPGVGEGKSNILEAKWRMRIQITEKKTPEGREKNQQKEVLHDSMMKCYFKIKGINTQVKCY